jgi:hypothetical protein
VFEHDLAGGGSLNSTDNQTSRGSGHAVLELPEPPIEIRKALREAADRLDLAVLELDDGRVMLWSRWPRRRLVVLAEVLPGAQGSRVDLIAIGPAYWRVSGYPSLVMARVGEFIEAASRHGSERSRERDRTVASWARGIRVGELPVAVTGVVLAIVGELIGRAWSVGLEITGIWLALVVPMCLEILRRRVTRTSPRYDLASLTLPVVVAVALTCALALL